ncbi:MAG: ATP synthase subunit I [bacterium]|nr:ATP synthase subunit I [bacterium]
MPDQAVMKSPDSSRRLELSIVLLVVAGTLLSLIWRDSYITWSFAIGGVLMVVNFRLLRMIVKNLLNPEKVSKAKLVAQVVVKFLGGLGALAAIMLWLKPQPIAFLLGLSTLVVAMALEGLMGIFRQ